VSTPAPGPLGEEALRLVEAAREWAVRTFPEVDARSASGATGAPECGWCPLCRAVAVLRGDRPEVTERLAEAVTTAAGALAAVLDAVGRPAPTPGSTSSESQPPSTDGSSSSPSASARGRTDFQRIEVDCE
jgi:hypothetical protein